MSEHGCDGGRKYDAGYKRQDLDGIKVTNVLAEILFDLSWHDLRLLSATVFLLLSFTGRAFPGEFQAITALSNGRQAPAYCCSVAGPDQRRSAEIDVADVCECADDRDQDRAQEADDHNLQMGSAVGGVYQMIHGVPASLLTCVVLRVVVPPLPLKPYSVCKCAPAWGQQAS